MFTDNENDMMFPNWFNQTIIQSKGIKKITRNLYESSKDSTLENLSPREIRTYQFDTSGRVLSVCVEQFYEYMNLGEILFTYNSSPDEFGFTNPTIKEENEGDLLEQFQLFEKIEYGEKFLVYKSQSSGNYKFHMLYKDNWGALSLDSILSPTSQDLIVLGWPMKPEQSFYMENTVNQAHKKTYIYSKKGQFLKLKEENFPFRKQRSINYDNNGFCTGFVDSTFNDRKFLLRKNSSFMFDNKLPSQLIHTRSSAKTGLSHQEIETFQYSYFQE